MATKKAKNNIFASLLQKYGAKKLTIFGIIAVIAVAAITAAIIIIVNIKANNYKRPLKVVEKISAAKEYTDPYDTAIMQSNGFCEKELKQLKKLLKTTENYEKNLGNHKNNYLKVRKAAEGQYGEDFKYSITSTSEQSLTETELDAVRNQIQKYSVDIMKQRLDFTKDYNDDNWETLALRYKFGDDVKKAKKCVEILEKIQQKFEKGEITEGYVLNYKVFIEGSKLKEPKLHEEKKLTVFKIDGRWVGMDFAESVIGLSFLTDIP